METVLLVSLWECLGVSLSAGLAWMVIPRTWAHVSLGFLDFQSWRLFVVLCSVPSITSALLFKMLMPESPKFLMEVWKGLGCCDALSYRVVFETFCFSSLPGWPRGRGDPRLQTDVWSEHKGKRQGFPGMQHRLIYCILLVTSVLNMHLLELNRAI